MKRFWPYPPFPLSHFIKGKPQRKKHGFLSTQALEKASQVETSQSERRGSGVKRKKSLRQGQSRFFKMFQMAAIFHKKMLSFCAGHSRSMDHEAVHWGEGEQGCVFCFGSSGTVHPWRAAAVSGNEKIPAPNAGNVSRNNLDIFSGNTRNAPQSTPTQKTRTSWLLACYQYNKLILPRIFTF